MHRGDIYYADLNLSLGSEINKKRPVVIVSNNINNKFSDTVTIVPLTSNINKIFPFEVLLLASKTGILKDSKAQCHQVRTISKVRLDKLPCGELTTKEVFLIEEALRLHLDL